MEIRTLRSFVVVAREGNVTRAARHLHITQPALSRQLSELERELGCALLVREARGVTLTDEGRLLRKRAEEIVSLADRAEAEVRSPAAEVEGDVWIGGGESRAMETVARVAAQIRCEHPGIRFRMHSGNGADVLERVDRGLLDFGVIFGDVPDKGRYESLPLPHKDTWGVLMQRGHALSSRESLTFEDLKNERLIVSGEGSDMTESGSSILQRYTSQGLNVVATYTLLYNGSLLVEQGVGIAICFDGIVRAGEGTPFSYVPLKEMPATPSLLVWKRFQSFSRPCELFLQAMRSSS